jgi:hypothetical protein
MDFTLSSTPRHTAETFKSDMLIIYRQNLEEAVKLQMTAKLAQSRNVAVGRTQAFREMIDFLENLQIKD